MNLSDRIINSIKSGGNYATFNLYEYMGVQQSFNSVLKSAIWLFIDGVTLSHPVNKGMFLRAIKHQICSKTRLLL